MTIEKADQPRKIHLTLWSPSSAPEGQEIVNPIVRATDCEPFRFYQPATNERGGFYAEA
jgi:hypothetical protein